MDIREGINIIKEHKGSTQVNRKELLLIFSTPIFAIVYAVYNVLTSIFKIEQKFLPFGELLDLQVVSAVLFSHISADSIHPISAMQESRTAYIFAASSIMNK